MRIRSFAGLAAALVMAVPAVAVAAGEDAGGGQPPEDVVEAARGAAAEASGVARELHAEIAENGEPQGRGSQAFADRHAELAALHAEHPGNAAAVHAALAAGEPPATAAGNGRGNGGTPPGLAGRSEAEALRGARGLFEDGHPGIGRGAAGDTAADPEE